MGLTSLQKMRRECAGFFEALWTGTMKPLVFGDGLEKEPVLMLIGEAPGEQEVLQGKPFAEKAGKNLDAFLETLELTRNDIYVTNVVKIRPTKTNPAGRMVNRTPSSEEIALFTPWLMKEIALVRPKALVTLGNVAMHVFLPKSKTMSECHGKWHQVVAAPPKGRATTLPMFVLYQPASVIYRAELKETYQRDVEILRDSLRLPKQSS